MFQVIHAKYTEDLKTSFATLYAFFRISWALDQLTFYTLSERIFTANT